MGDIVEVRRRDGGISFKGRIRRKGQKLLTKTFKRKTDAGRWIQTLEGKLNEGKSIPPSKRYTVLELIERYIRDVLPQKKQSTQSVQRQKLDYWKERIGYMRLFEVLPDVLAAERRHLLESKVDRGKWGGKADRGPASVNRYMAVLRHVFSVAVREWQWMESNPVGRIPALREAAPRECILTDQELKALLVALEKHPRQDFRLIVHLALTTGCRRGNAQAVRWEDIDFSHKTVTFPDTKNNRPHAAPLSDAICEEIKAWKLKSGGSTGYLFPSELGSRTPYVDIKQVWRRFATKDLNRPRLRFHDLRHAVASFLAKENVSLYAIGRLLGHKSLESTKRYAHIGVSDLAAQSDMLEERLRRVK